jgi:hypothetical protein
MTIGRAVPAVARLRLFNRGAQGAVRSGGQQIEMENWARGTKHNESDQLINARQVH